MVTILSLIPNVDIWLRAPNIRTVMYGELQAAPLLVSLQLSMENVLLVEGSADSSMYAQ